MMDMTRACWQWMMSLGVVGMLIGVGLLVGLLVGLVAAVVLLIVRLVGKGGRPSSR